jgi:RND family efflux transporter MFP subunit
MGIVKMISWGGLIALAIGLSACKEGQAAGAPQEMAIPVKIAALSATPTDEYSDYIATIRSRRSVEIRPQVDGYISRILVKPGEPVIEGASLLQIDPKRQQATTSSAVAASGIASAELDRGRATLGQLEAARAGRVAALKLAEEDHRRTSALRQSGALAQQAEDQATATLESARAELLAADRQIAAQRAGVSSAEKSLVQTQATAQAESVGLQYYRIAAPFLGTVGDVPVKVGDLVTPATLLTTIDDPTSPLEAWISVPIEDARRLKPGLTARVLESRSGAVRGEGKVTFVSPRIDPATQSVLVKVELDGKGAEEEIALRAQQFLRARIIWSTEPGIRVPVTSITRLNGQTFAYLVKDVPPARVASQVPVRLGDVQGNDVIVKDGLKAGDRIVASGIQKLHDGSKVAPVTL